MSTHTRAYVTAVQGGALFVLCMAIGVGAPRAAAIAVAWVGGTAALGYAAGQGWLGRRAQDFIMCLIGHDAPGDDDDDARKIAARLAPCPHGGDMDKETGHCVLDASHPPVTCVGCGKLYCACRECWRAHQDEWKCAVDRERQAKEMNKGAGAPSKGAR